jgi:hypothetical protein
VKEDVPSFSEQSLPWQSKENVMNMGIGNMKTTGKLEVNAGIVVIVTIQC